MTAVLTRTTPRRHLPAGVVPDQVINAAHDLSSWGAELEDAHRSASLALRMATELRHRLTSYRPGTQRHAATTDLLTDAQTSYDAAMARIERASLHVHNANTTLAQHYRR